MSIACPNNLIGTVDLYLTTHHGLAQSNAPVIVHALKPRVAIMNNGPTKGGEPAAWQVVRDSPGLQDLWQLHHSVAGGRDHNVAESMIANPDESAAHYLKASAWRDGRFTVTNSGNGVTKSYPAR